MELTSATSVRPAPPLTLVRGDAHARFDLELQRELTTFNRHRLLPRLPDDLEERGAVRPGLDERRLMEREAELMLAERAEVAEQAAHAPREPEAFVRWFEALRDDGPGQGDPLFPWLAEHASFPQMRWFLGQEVAGEAGFDDLVALTQVRVPDQAKLEMARNYWDEMGRGKTSGMHGPMLARLATALDVVVPLDHIEAEPLALGNLMLAMATNRQFAYHAIGALGIIEQTAPGRSEYVNAGLKRLGVRPHDRQYFALHATLDVAHSIAWNREVLAPLVREKPATARALAEGALIRLTAGARCFARYRAVLGVS